MTHKELESYLLSFSNTWVDYPFGEGIAVYKFGHKETGDGTMYAIIEVYSKPLRVSLKCDPNLAVTLRETYETVVPGYHLSKKHWNTIICSGQLSREEIKDLARHSYNLVTNN
ncbi:MAG: MmcQ/YjbR family DNA-binding protein [Candidatus Microsaccharimonas sossegonensis]|uniref:MmcQ/YjbR family DNA-binding protein n=1 Tax=Candidatus Microsaccharimonas sossegonensis TaxID=2506948 RepID=A0A4Q0AHE2_9BACT|nr:MAG: MmcQ/YjbR family DNA-binding protein [Candidatus Microsaccharimonas sossegonensis]